MPRGKKTADSVLEPCSIKVTASERQLHLVGAIGVAQAKTLKTLALQLAQPGAPVVVHAAHLRHLDCAAAQVLLALHETLQGNRTGLSFTSLPASVQDTLNIAGLSQVFATPGASD